MLIPKSNRCDATFKSALFFLIADDNCRAEFVILDFWWVAPQRNEDRNELLKIACNSFSGKFCNHETQQQSKICLTKTEQYIQPKIFCSNLIQITWIYEIENISIAKHLKEHTKPKKFTQQKGKTMEQVTRLYYTYIYIRYKGTKQ